MLGGRKELAEKIYGCTGWKQPLTGTGFYPVSQGGFGLPGEFTDLSRKGF